MKAKREQRVFLVRMWREESALAADWRGSVHDVASGRRFYCSSPIEIADLIAGTLPETAPALPSEPKT